MRGNRVPGRWALTATFVLVLANGACARNSAEEAAPSPSDQVAPQATINSPGGETNSNPLGSAIEPGPSLTPRAQQVYSGSGDWLQDYRQEELRPLLVPTRIPWSPTSVTVKHYDGEGVEAMVSTSDEPSGSSFSSVINAGGVWVRVAPRAERWVDPIEEFGGTPHKRVAVKGHPARLYETHRTGPDEQPPDPSYQMGGNMDARWVTIEVPAGGAFVEWTVVVSRKLQSEADTLSMLESWEVIGT